MSTHEILWMILQERRRQASAAARERLALASAPAPTRSSVSLVGRLRQRLAGGNDRTLQPVQGAPGR